MSRVVLLPRAKDDLSNIWDYTLAAWGLEQADDPSLSVDIGAVRKGYRKVRCGSHLISFRLTDEGIDVVRILHQKMDFDRHV